MRWCSRKRNSPARIVQPTPRPIIGVAGEIYQTPRLNVNIVHARCSDGMSDRVYPDKVQVTADGRRFEGCGGEAVVPAALAGTNWRVAAINGRATPPAGQFFMNFEADADRRQVRLQRARRRLQPGRRHHHRRAGHGYAHGLPRHELRNARAGAILERPMQDDVERRRPADPVERAQRSIDLIRSY